MLMLKSELPPDSDKSCSAYLHNNLSASYIEAQYNHSIIMTNIGLQSPQFLSSEWLSAVFLHEYS